MKTVFHALLVPALMLLCVCFFTLGLVVAQEPTPPKMSIEVHDAIATARSQQFQYLEELEDIRKKYQNLMQADPQFKDLSTKLDAASKQLQEGVQDAMKGVDPKKWMVDVSGIKYAPVTPQEKPEKK